MSNSFSDWGENDYISPETDESWMTRARGALICIAGEYRNRVFPITERRMILGRGPGCHVRFKVDGTVSGRHVQITMKNYDFLLTDLNSRNGTLKNEDTIKGETTSLANKDIVRIGQQTFMFRCV